MRIGARSGRMRAHDPRSRPSRPMSTCWKQTAGVSTWWVPPMSAKPAPTLVEQVIREQRPDTVCIELCDSRFETLNNPERWKETDLFSVIRSGRAYVLMAQLVLAVFPAQARGGVPHSAGRGNAPGHDGGRRGRARAGAGRPGDSHDAQARLGRGRFRRHAENDLVAALSLFTATGQRGRASRS